MLDFYNRDSRTSKRSILAYMDSKNFQGRRRIDTYGPKVRYDILDFHYIRFDYF